MQTVAGYPTDLSVVEPTALVIVNGAPAEVESVSVSRELTSSLPSQVAATSGLTAATGSVVWNVGEDVQERSAHPWDGNSFPPKPADEVVVFAGYGEALVRQLTGSIDDSQGSIASDELSSELVDPIDKLNRTVSFPALLNAMPPWDEDGPILRLGLRPAFITDRILRACGFHATPPRATSCVVSAPHMGSAWPEMGTVTRSNRQGNSAAGPTYVRTPWGLGLASADIDYAPNIANAGGNGRLNRTMQITLKSGPDAGTSGESHVRAYWGSAYVSLTVWSTRAVSAIVHTGSSSTTVCTLPAAAVADADVFTLRITQAGAVTLLANNSQSATGSTSLPSVMTTTDMERVRVYVVNDTGVRIGGVQVNFGATNINRSQQTATLTPAFSTPTLWAFPRIEPTNALDLLKEQAEAVCASIWIDEHGHFRWVDKNHFTLEAPVATLTALDDVLDIGWSSSASGVRSRVVLTSRDGSLSRSNFSNKVAWQGKGESLEAGNVHEEIASPPADTDWIGVDEDLKMLPGSLAGFNRGRGTWAGGVATDDDGSQWATIDNPSFSVTMQKLGDSVYKFTANAGSPPGGRTVELRTPDDESTTAVWKSKRNLDLPILRAKGIVEWTDRETVGLHVGPDNTATLEHNVGPWLQDAEALQELADWLSAHVFEPKPVLRDLSVIPDFRRQLGDIVWVEDERGMRIRLRVLITKLDTTVSVGSAEQTVGGRILEVQSYGVTNERLDAHAGSRTNAGFDTLWADATNAQLDTDPLGRG